METSSHKFTANSFADIKLDLSVGRHPGGLAPATLAQFYSYDDFRIYTKALTRAQIIASSASETPSAALYGVGCGSAGVPALKATGVPRLGNAKFALAVSGAEKNKPLLVGLGLQAHLGGLLPLALGGGCRLETSANVAVIGAATNSSGSFSLPVAVPNTASLAGTHGYFQFVVNGTSAAVTRGMDVNIQR